MSKVSVLHVNGTRYPVDADPETSLLTVLRDQPEGFCGPLEWPSSDRAGGDGV